MTNSLMYEGPFYAYYFHTSFQCHHLFPKRGLFRPPSGDLFILLLILLLPLYFFTLSEYSPPLHENELTILLAYWGRLDATEEAATPLLGESRLGG